MAVGLLESSRTSCRQLDALLLGFISHELADVEVCLLVPFRAVHLRLGVVHVDERVGVVEVLRAVFLSCETGAICKIIDDN